MLTLQIMLNVFTHLASYYAKDYADIIETGLIMDEYNCGWAYKNQPCGHKLHVVIFL